MSNNNIKSMFENKFDFKRSDDWILPPVEQTFQDTYEFTSLQEMKGSLNGVKSKLNKYPLKEWKKHTARRNISGSICWKLKKSIDAELVTKAWCKFYECVNEFPILPGNEFNSFHLCELPGAFVASLNHYLRSTYQDIKWKWLATSLNPYHEGNMLGEMVTDDRFLFHTFDKWIFGEDFTGNIIDKKNIEKMASDVKTQIGNVHLITADGSIDCFKSPELQEEMVYQLQFAELYTALRILTNHGSFLFKTFTLFQATTISMIYLLNCVFDQVSITKPATSKSGNSEVYVVCINYQKNTVNLNNLLEILSSKIGNNANPIFSKSSLPTEFISQIHHVATYFMINQTNAIEANIFYFDNPCSLEDKRCITDRDLFCEEYFKRFKVRKIRKENRIVCEKIFKDKGTNKICNNFLMNYYRNNGKSSFYENHLETWSIQHSWLFDTKRKEFTCNSNKVELKVNKGKTVDDLNNSKFIELKLNLLRNDIGSLSQTNDNLVNIPIYNQSAKAYLKFTDNSNDFNIDFIFSKNDTFGQSERNFFKKLFNFILIHEPSTVVFENYIFLTHFSVSILTVLLNNIYEKLEFNANNSSIILNSIQKPNAGCEIRKLLSFLISEDANKILCFLDIKDLHYNEFIDVLMLFNNMLLSKECKNLLNN